MKSYWIAGTIILLGTWPSGTKAYATGAGQSPAVEKPAQQAQSSAPTPAAPQETGNDALKTTQPATSAAPAVPAVSAPSTSAQNKGSYLLVELSKGLKAKKLKPGDKVKAEVTQDVVSHGKVIIPVQTELIGHVTEVSVRGEGFGPTRDQEVACRPAIADAAALHDGRRRSPILSGLNGPFRRLVVQSRGAYSHVKLQLDWLPGPIDRQTVTHNQRYQRNLSRT